VRKTSPKFWQKKGLLAWLSLPLSLFWRLGAKIKQSKITSYRSSLPVICVGNITVGGAGKTPTCLALAAALKKQGMHPVFLSRGYGGREQGPLVVDHTQHSSKDVGDEPLLLAQLATTVIAKDRVAGLKQIETMKHDIVIMDDGLQNAAIEKTFSICVFDGPFGIGNGFVMPAGPLREPFKAMMSHADAAIIIGEDDKQLRSKHPMQR